VAGLLHGHHARRAWCLEAAESATLGVSWRGLAWAGVGWRGLARAAQPVMDSRAASAPLSSGRSSRVPDASDPPGGAMTGARGGMIPAWLACCCCGTAETARRTGRDTLAPHTEQRAARLAPVAPAVDQLERRLARRGPLAEARSTDEAVAARAQPEGSRRGVGARQPPGTWQTAWRLLGLPSGLGSTPGCAGRGALPA
jgi:hypothetical protein